MIIKLIYIKDIAILDAKDLVPCGDAFSMRLKGKLISICGNVYELSEDIPKFRKGALRAANGVYLIECDEDMNCVAARSR